MLPQNSAVLEEIRKLSFLPLSYFLDHQLKKHAETIGDKIALVVFRYKLFPQVEYENSTVKLSYKELYEKIHRMKTFFLDSGIGEPRSIQYLRIYCRKRRYSFSLSRKFLAVCRGFSWCCLCRGNYCRIVCLPNKLGTNCFQKRLMSDEQRRKHALRCRATFVIVPEKLSGEVADFISEIGNIKVRSLHKLPMSSGCSYHWLQ